MTGQPIRMQKQDTKHKKSNLQDNIKPVSYTHLDVYKRQDMYSFMTKTYHRMDTEIPYLSRDIIPLKVADNETNSYREALINILYACLLYTSRCV